MSMDGEICSQRPATSKTCNSGPALPLLCYNKGCGKTFTEEQNSEESCLYHPGVPIFHDALKGWSCCRKRTTDFSEFLTIKGCTKGHHNSQKPLELLQPEVTSSKQLPDQLGPSWSPELIVQGPKSAEKLQRERPSSEEPKEMLVKKVSQMLMQALEKMNLVSEEKSTEQEETASLVDVGSKCQNSGCKEIYKGSESETEVCVFHPGIPVFHEGMKYWSCCAIKTTDFNTFLEQKGCSTAKHTWKKKEDKKMVSCRQDWHQTSGQVVVTVYAKNPLPELCSVQANRTGKGRLLPEAPPPLQQKRNGRLVCIPFPAAPERGLQRSQESIQASNAAVQASRHLAIEEDLKAHLYIPFPAAPGRGVQRSQ
ncbi:integrin beta-1-binding protein 2 isoform X2 [Rhinatrema bivittatum]|uniref:integrin beta-1-binding protein 2 isoform X2 n=1 Tax=Rhinatrema bivittatum TaxID=194408 RepID=UPI00112786DB|nr:integrin beta-1-binding protein 2 isoform X2 [Rhinatrema bivittatum]